MLASDGQRNFFKNVKNYKSTEHEAPFPYSLPGKTEEEVMETLAEHFKSISSEFEPLEQHQIPVNRSKMLPLLQPYGVAGRIIHFKKPQSMVKGNTFPALVYKHGDFFGYPPKQHL